LLSLLAAKKLRHGRRQKGWREIPSDACCASAALAAGLSSGYIHEVENGNNAVFGNKDDRAALVDCVIDVFQLWHFLRQNCRKI
jgi:hypothetical protein